MRTKKMTRSVRAASALIDALVVGVCLYYGIYWLAGAVATYLVIYGLREISYDDEFDADEEAKVVERLRRIEAHVGMGHGNDKSNQH